MRNTAKLLSTVASVAALLGSLTMVAAPTATAADEQKKLTPVEEGKKIAFDRKKGNCLACHQIEDGALPGNMGPPLVAMKARFPNKDRLRAQIHDPTQFNPGSAMPPFGKHKILSEDEVNKVVEYIHTL